MRKEVSQDRSHLQKQFTFTSSQPQGRSSESPLGSTSESIAGDSGERDAMSSDAEELEGKERASSTETQPASSASSLRRRHHGGETGRVGAWGRNKNGRVL